MNNNKILRIIHEEVGQQEVIIFEGMVYKPTLGYRNNQLLEIYDNNGVLLLTEGVIDDVQGVLDWAGFIPGIGDFLDAINAIIYMFRKKWDFNPATQNKAETLAQMEDCLEALQKQVDKGNIRHFGLSNESAWGTAQWLRLSEDRGLPRVATIQNEYSLLCRLYDTDLAELSVNEEVGLIAFSPLAAGLLTGKYQDSVTPAGSRKTFTADLGGRTTQRVWPAVDAYSQIAAKHEVDIVHMSLAWCLTRPFMCSAIFGATRHTQLEHILKTNDVVLSAECLADITEAHKSHPMPF